MYVYGHDRVAEFHRNAVTSLRFVVSSSPSPLRFVYVLYTFRFVYVPFHLRLRLRSCCLRSFTFRSFAISFALRLRVVYGSFVRVHILVYVAFVCVYFRLRFVYGFVYVHVFVYVAFRLCLCLRLFFASFTFFVYVYIAGDGDRAGARAGAGWSHGATSVLREAQPVANRSRQKRAVGEPNRARAGRRQLRRTAISTRNILKNPGRHRRAVAEAFSS